jgi:hypothetical protein
LTYSYTIKLDTKNQGKTKMLSVNTVITPSLERSYVARNGGNGRFHGLARSQGAAGKHDNESEMSWLVIKGGSGKNLSEAWDSYLTSKGFTAGPLKDRLKAFFRTGVQA